MLAGRGRSPPLPEPRATTAARATYGFATPGGGVTTGATETEADATGRRGVADDFLVFLVRRVFDFHEWREAGEAVLDVRVDRRVGAVGGAGEREDGQRVFALAGVEDDDVRVDCAGAIAGCE